MVLVFTNLRKKRAFSIIYTCHALNEESPIEAGMELHVLSPL